MGLCTFKGASEKKFISAENSVKTPTRITFYNDFSHVVISKYDCDTIKNLRCSPVNGHNRITTYERTETRAGTGSGHWPVVDIIARYRRFRRPCASRAGGWQQQPVAWPVLIVLVFPVAIVFAVLGRHFPARVAWRILLVWPLAHAWSASPDGYFCR